MQQLPGWNIYPLMYCVLYKTFSFALIVTLIPSTDDDDDDDSSQDYVGVFPFVTQSSLFVMLVLPKPYSTFQFGLLK